jgi:3-deoxy-D-manno-octulosonic-acid transferase
MSLPFGLRLYRTATGVLAPLTGPLLQWRAGRGKEDGARLGERFGRTSAPRPRGTLVWLHGASVGETRVLMQVREALAARRSDLSFLFTSGTRTSASLLANPPAHAVHQYAPVDRVDAARRFLAHWRPDLAVFAESDLWPNLIEETVRSGAKLALVNARISPRSLAAWARRPASARHLFGRFNTILAADARTADGIGAFLGRTIAAPGNLKLAAPAPKVDADALDALRREIGLRPVWIAASTHPGEDEIVLEAHKRIQGKHPDALLVIAPRHPERGAAIAALAGHAPRRSMKQAISQSSVFIADTIGELGLFYALAPVSLVAGSLLPHLKGHNPVEPAKLKSAILTGPHVESFADTFTELLAAKGAITVHDADAIADIIAHLWASEPDRAALLDAAAAVTSRGGASLDKTINALEALLPAPAHAAA